MANDQEEINHLLQKLELLLKKQQDFNIEVNEIRRDIQILRNTQALKFNETLIEETSIAQEIIPEKEPVVTPEAVITQTSISAETAATPVQNEPIISSEKKILKPKGKSNLEKFIGENLINKIGILITVIGVVIGAKYSIENNLISPLTRIILGYLVGLGLLGFGFKLKAKYKSYSAVLVSGALAILYFLTFIAYDLYGLFPQMVAFGIMLVFTIFGVVAAINYNKQIIAHIGLVGAYAVPFLLSNDSGNATALFSYIALINIGLLVISFKKYWKALYYVAFIFTWLIYGSWYVFSSNTEDFTMGFAFLAIFFSLFYATFLAFKLIKSEKFQVGDIILIMLNSFIFYGFGIACLYNYEGGEFYLGLFTLFNALIHFAITVLIFKRKLADRKLFFLTSGFVLTFITIAVPVQLDGNWVTMIWAFEAALLFWIGRTKKVSFYEYLSYLLAALSIFSLSMDWSETYSWLSSTNDDVSSFLNSTFLTSILCVAAYGIMLYFQSKHTLERKSLFHKLMDLGIPALFILTLYFAIYFEIEHYWNNAFHASKIEVSGTAGNYPEYNYNLNDLKAIWKLLYTMLFISIVSFINSKKVNNKTLGIVAFGTALFTTLTFLTNGLYTLSELRENYLAQELAEFYNIGAYNIYIRYISFLFFALLLFTIYKLAQQQYLKFNFKIPFEILLHTAILWVTSSELLNWMDLSGSEQSYKLALSILWGVYALLLIGLGIWKKKKHLRIGAIVLFSITLVKLFFYDISSLNTISKTIVFVSLGVLLLIISFLYNKYKHIIFDETKL
ncbi:DUF2339 domain-containing protein [Maribacter hydrothermalis]|uniref:DUF2339 domain-containing protein n=1 Tax=Maribacter hydrothermalis TaxID=1836467 RepID=A0A1B7Z6X8_9FLAO|nr:DUF2339 domain-containing protein [Maribacter hydrothermalis]APQ16371.1 hypothetical protein BTR34_03020 [Maribacter hydrothermalis]OBR38473.1 hypothetical protein A9200_17530 [Maribacter hydrothermalis]